MRYLVDVLECILICLLAVVLIAFGVFDAEDDYVPDA